MLQIRRIPYFIIMTNVLIQIYKQIRIYIFKQAHTNRIHVDMHGKDTAMTCMDTCNRSYLQSNYAGQICNQTDLYHKADVDGFDIRRTRVA